MDAAALRDVIQNVLLCYLPPRDLLALALTCRSLRALIDAEFSWQSRWHSEGLPERHAAIDAHVKDGARPWRTLYIKMWLLRRFLQPSKPLLPALERLKRMSLDTVTPDDLNFLSPDLITNAAAVIFHEEAPQDMWIAPDQREAAGAFVMRDGTFAMHFRSSDGGHHSESIFFTAATEEEFVARLHTDFAPFAMPGSSLSHLVPRFDRAAWHAYLLAMVHDPSGRYVLHSGPQPRCLLRLCAPCVIHVHCGDARATFRVRGHTSSAKAALLEEITAHFSTDEEPLVRFTDLPRWETFDHGDVITLLPLTAGWHEVAAALERRGESERALHWCREAAERGDRFAAYRCGVRMARDPKLRNFAEAERWLTIAAQRGHPKADSALQEMRASPEFHAQRLQNP